MKWYKFLKYFFLPFATVSALADFTSIKWKGGVVYYLPDAIFVGARAVCFGAALYGMIKMRESGPRYLLTGCMVTFYYNVIVMLCAMFSDSLYLFHILSLIGSAVFWRFNRGYFRNRQHLFSEI